MKLSLVVINAGKASGQTISIKTPQFVIGRDPECNLRPASAMISKKHCALAVKGGQVFLQDFESTNGTFVNEKQITGTVELKNEDVLKVGPLSFKVVIETTPSPTKPTPPPKQVRASAEDDAAAMLLSLEDGSITAPTEEGAPEVPGGSTVMDVPSFSPDGVPVSKSDEKKKKEEKAKHDSAAQAAAALIDRMRKGARK
jgi:pSer/pThr/pTyr-binding forkhead associated (FHA) protein